MTAPADIAGLIGTVAQAMHTLCDLITDAPDAALFHANRDAFLELERAWNLKASLDPAIAHAADKAEAGRLVGSSRTVDYLTRTYGLSFTEAQSRLRSAAHRYGPAPVPAPASVPASVPSREAEPEPEPLPEVQQRRERARRSRLSKEKLAIIDAELARLSTHVATERDRLRSAAIDEACHRNPEDLQEWVRARVRHCNRRVIDPLEPMRKRTFWIGKTDHLGGATFGGYAPPALLALLDSTLAPARNKGAFGPDLDGTTPAPGLDDRRTVAQRRLDGLWHILRNHGTDSATRAGGAASLVISVDAAELTEADARTHLPHWPTNTHAQLTPIDLLMVGLARYDVGVLHDHDTGTVLHAGRSRRTASLLQRLALFAEQLVCSHPGCTQPACQTDVHHIVPWLKQGRTDIENLTLLCRRHHTDNNDNHDGAHNMGHAERDPHTGRAGYRPASPPGAPPRHLEFNNTEAAQRSAGHRIRTRTRTQAPESVGSPEPGPSPPRSTDSS
ncbi:HNH endonuclease [Corynebacterium uberis]|uniref:HNH endonuclease signature motif containing protein n=1 Tax=Corynebacterium uberis TaxID=2883169 RepID=UPI001D09DF47|nr:HNH endonuclease signature motif containing protein [Corynebacterium uberis]UDL73414.1 HNH endonuclease [Corynebacterium uberis]UDL82336.1 HNH endonuclease [Corynebacterium uberis]